MFNQHISCLVVCHDSEHKSEGIAMSKPFNLWMVLSKWCCFASSSHVTHPEVFTQKMCNSCSWITMADFDNINQNVWELTQSWWCVLWVFKSCDVELRARLVRGGNLLNILFNMFVRAYIPLEYAQWMCRHIWSSLHSAVRLFFFQHQYIVCDKEVESG